MSEGKVSDAPSFPALVQQFFTEYLVRQRSMSRSKRPKNAFTSSLTSSSSAVIRCFTVATVRPPGAGSSATSISQISVSGMNST